MGFIVILKLFDDHSISIEYRCLVGCWACDYFESEVDYTIGSHILDLLDKSWHRVHGQTRTLSNHYQILKLYNLFGRYFVSHRN